MTVKTSDPREWSLAFDRFEQSWYIENEYGEEVMLPTLKHDHTYSPRWRDYKTALAALHDAIADALGNYEPPDPPGWEGGFADNH